MNMRKTATLTFTLLFLLTGAMAQTGSISGTVTDESGTALAGANVMVEGTDLGAATDVGGNYSISSVPAGTYAVTASFVGYESASQSVTVGAGRSTANFSLAISALAGREVAIIGSRFARAAEDQAVPVDVFTAAEIRETGFTETGQILQALAPSFNMPKTSITDGSDTVRPMTLRGLGSGQVLVLINGKRRHPIALVHVNNSPSRGDTGVDLDAIPAAAIERIEVLRDGAAAQYGSDAIAGVINIVLKSGDNDGNLTFMTGQNYHDVEAVPTGFDLYDWAATGEPYEWNPTTEVDYSRDADGTPRAIVVSSEPFTKNDGQFTQLQYTKGFQIGDGGSLFIAAELRNRGTTNRVGFEGEQYYEPNSDYWSNDDAEANRLNPGSDFFVPVDRMIWGDNKMNNWGIFLNSVVPSGDKRYYAFGGYTFRRGDTGCFTRQPDQPHKVWLSSNPNGFVPHITPDVTDNSLAVGMEGVFGNWSYDLSTVYGKNNYHFKMFSTNASYGPEILRTYDIGGFNNSQWSNNLDMTTSFGNIDLAVGAEYRTESFRIFSGEQQSYANGQAGTSVAGWDAYTTSDDTNGVAYLDTFITGVNSKTASGGCQCFSGFKPSNEAATREADRTSIAGYVDAEYELMSNLRLGAALRFEDYSDFGSTINFKGTARYEVMPGIVLRGAGSTGFRAPALAQAFQSKVATNFLPDPETGETVAFEVGTFPVDNPVAQALGAIDLKPETSTNISAGASVTLAGIKINFDYYIVDIDDRIVLTGNFKTKGVQRDVDGNITVYNDTLGTDAGTIEGNLGVHVFNLLDDNNIPGADFGGGGRFFTNAVSTSTNGFDITASYDITLGSIGDLNVSLAYNSTSTEIVGEIGTPAELSGYGATLFSTGERRTLTSVQPKENLILTGKLKRGSLGLTARINRVGEYYSRFADDPDDWADAGYSTPPWDYIEDEDGKWIRVFTAKVVTDVEVSYDLGGVNFAVGAKNLMDVMPDKRVLFARVNDGAFTYPNHNPFGMNGRFMYVRIGYNF